MLNLLCDLSTFMRYLVQAVAVKTILVRER